MDAVDVAILRRMDARPFGTRPKHPDSLKPAHIAEQLGTTHVTVRERIARMEEAGVIQGYEVYPNFRHLGVTSNTFFCEMEDEETKRTAIKRLHEMASVFEIHDLVGLDACVDVWYSDPAVLVATRQAIAEATGDPSPSPLYVRPMPTVERTLTSLDWRIVQALRGRARRPLAEVAEDVGVSLKTVRRRHDRMALEGSLFAVPVVDLSRMSGLIPVCAHIFAAGPLSTEQLQEILRVYEDRRVNTYFAANMELGHLGVVLFATSLADVEQLRTRALDVPGIERASAWAYRGWTVRTGWIDAAIVAKIEAAGA